MYWDIFPWDRTLCMLSSEREKEREAGREP